MWRDFYLHMPGRFLSPRSLYLISPLSQLNVTCIHHEYLPRTVCSTMWREYTPVFHIGIPMNILRERLEFNDTSISPFESEFLPSLPAKKWKISDDAKSMVINTRIKLTVQHWKKLNFHTSFDCALFAHVCRFCKQCAITWCAEV